MCQKSDADVIAADPRYATIRARAKAADGQFVFAVCTTGVFCKPSCPARLPRPENVRFFATAAEALDAGFRACLRCRPTLGTAPDPMTDLMQAMAHYISDHADEPLTLDRLAAQAQLSPFHFQRTFKAVLGVSPRDYQAGLKLDRFKAGLKQGADVLDATFDAGFGSTSRIYDRIDGGLGMTPAVYRAGGAGETISYASRESALGILMMAATDRGVCFVQFGDDADALLAMLGREFPRAALRPADPAADEQLAHWMAALDDHLSRGGPHPDLPLDLRGTAFQLKVWKFLLGVKPGSVVSYAEVATGIGAPRAVRAAASACAANRVGVLVPCHRVLRTDGSLGGYRWGLARKRALLAMESAA